MCKNIQATLRYFILTYTETDWIKKKLKKQP